MSDELQNTEAVASGEPSVAGEASQEEVRQVPLAALEAERHKRQELEAQNKALQEILIQKSQPQPVEEEEVEEPEAWVNRKELKSELERQKFIQKRDILEEHFKETNPEAMKAINSNLKKVLEKKPWLLQSIESAPNRYARAYEIVQDYSNVLAPFNSDAKKIIQNSQKPGSPVTVGKSAQLSGKDYLKSIQGKPEFREYRQKVMRGEI